MQPASCFYNIFVHSHIQNLLQITTCHISKVFPLASKAMWECFQTFLFKRLSYQPPQGKHKESKIWAHSVPGPQQVLFEEPRCNRLLGTRDAFSHRNPAACLTSWSKGHGPNAYLCADLSREDMQGLCLSFIITAGSHSFFLHIFSQMIKIKVGRVQATSSRSQRQQLVRPGSEPRQLGLGVCAISHLATP